MRVILARIPRATTNTTDITGGLPRVDELFEARHPRDKAVITEVDGTVHHGPVVKGMRRIIIETDEGTRHEHSVPRSVHVNVQEGERVRAGNPLDATLVAASMGAHQLRRLASSPSRSRSAAWAKRSRRSTAPLGVCEHRREVRRRSSAGCCGSSAGAVERSASRVATSHPRDSAA